MRITHVSTFDVQGGAARAAYRLHRGLVDLGQHSILLSRYKRSTDEAVEQLGPISDAPDFDRWCLDRLQVRYIDARRTAMSNTWFSLPYPGYHLAMHPGILASDVVNVHWVARFQSPRTVQRLLQHGPPAVWTLHDMWAFTGGCHFSSGCDGYVRDCHPCPQIRDDPDRLPSAVLADRVAAMDVPLTVVAPSRWLAARARESRLFRETRIEVIPNGVETSTFTPVPKPEAKQRLGLGGDTVALLAGADNGNERRKGFAVLAEALRICAADPAVQERIRRETISLLWFGVPPDDLGALPVPTRALGQIASDDRLREIYSASDLYLLPSLEDNLPNTMLEAMSCGTPVIGFHVGGIPDVLEDGVTGRLVPAGDAGHLARAILESLLGEGARKMSEACRRVIEMGYSTEVQARRYLGLYRDLCHHPRPAAAPRRLERAGEPPPAPTAEAPPADLAGLGAAIPDQGRGLLDCRVGPALQPLVRRWSLEVAQADLEELEGARAELGMLRREVDRLRERIRAMETSKFWKLRSVWFRIRPRIGLPGRE